jgi:hypothetical protein
MTSKNGAKHSPKTGQSAKTCGPKIHSNIRKKNAQLKAKLYAAKAARISTDTINLKHYFYETHFPEKQKGI